MLLIDQEVLRTLVDSGNSVIPFFNLGNFILLGKILEHG